MKKFLAATGWLLLFAAVGAAAMTGLAAVLLPHRVPLRFVGGIAAVGAVPGAYAWLIALCFGVLPGAKRAPGSPPRLGLAQGLWAMAGTALMLASGGIMPFMAAVYLMMIRILLRLPRHMPSTHDPYLLMTMLVAGELLAALWLFSYIRRQRPAVVHDGGATGIAWRPASLPAYATALGCVLVLLMLAALEMHFIPPNRSALANSTVRQLLAGPPAVIGLTVAVGAGLAPIVEEALFRGIAFAGIATRLGPGWAVVLTTAAFTFAHSAEMRYYPPGFALIAMAALLACALRLRYRSIRPGMLMHFLYNFCVMALPLLLHLP